MRGDILKCDIVSLSSHSSSTVKRRLFTNCEVTDPIYIGTQIQRWDLNHGIEIVPHLTVLPY